jgi:hypothetical protein
MEDNMNIKRRTTIVIAIVILALAIFSSAAAAFSKGTNNDLALSGSAQSHQAVQTSLPQARAGTSYLAYPIPTPEKLYYQYLAMVSK